jgi:translation initiation factor 3 subunit A
LYFQQTNLLSLRKLDEIAAKQKQREEEAEARRAARKAVAPAPAPVLAPAPAPAPAPTAAATPTPVEPVRAEPIAPRLNLLPRPGSGPSWRERQAAKGATIEGPKEEAQLPRKSSGYVPPHQRSSGGPPKRDDSPANGAPARPAREAITPQPPKVQSSSTAPPVADRPENSTQKWVPKWRQSQQQG